MQLVMLLLKTGHTLISASDELEYEPKVHLFEPMEVTGKTKVVLTPWPAYTDDKHILLNSNDLLTAMTPKEDIVSAYLKKVGKTLEDIQPKDDRVMLSEAEYVPDDYEPRYEEEA